MVPALWLSPSNRVSTAISVAMQTQTTNIPFTSYRRFYQEFKRLKSLHLTLEYVISRMAHEVKNDLYSGRMPKDEPVSLNGEDIVSTNPYGLLSRLRSQHPKYVREIIFVRLMSAIEVFLVDTFKEILTARPDLLPGKKTIEISYGELAHHETTTLLRRRAINREVRSVQNGGIVELVKFMERTLSVSLSEVVPSVTSFTEFRDRRNLLVHRLGRADEKYRRDYGFSGKDALSVDRDYLISVFETSDFLAEKLHETSQGIVSTGRRITKKQHEQVTELKIVPHSDIGRKALDPSHRIRVNDRIKGEFFTTLGDITTISGSEDGVVSLVLSGSRESIATYVRGVRKMSKKGHLDLVESNTVRKPPKLIPPSGLDRNMLESVARMMPSGQLPHGI